jgi:hypothetical protein
MVTYLEWVDFQVQVLVLDQAIDALGQNALEITLARTSASVCSHHARYRGIGSEKRAKLGRSFELG